MAVVSELEPSSNVSELSGEPAGSPVPELVTRRDPIVGTTESRLVWRADYGAGRVLIVVALAIGVLVFAGLYNRWSIGNDDATGAITSDAGSGASGESGADQAGDTNADSTATESSIGIVVYVIDGDTVDMEIDGERERVRLLGIDAPESVHRSVPEQCFGAEASAALTELLPVGSEVTLERDQDPRDRFGRLLLYLYRTEDGLFVNEWLVRNGLADTSFFEPNTALADTLTDARAEARAAQTGLWGSCDGPDQPLD